MDKTAQMFKALSQGVRLRVLSLLTEGELCVCDIMAALGLPQSTVSRHLSYLERAGLVSGMRRGVWMYYRLADDCELPLQKEVMDALTRAFPSLPQFIRDRDALARYLKTKDGAASCG
ncbi:MAG: metalloregulator ArsR/SmtB family transcription factor [Dissulfuribacterales bacterium]